MKTNYLGFIICLLFFTTGCTKNNGGNTTPVDPCTGLTVRFSTDVQPIFTTFCATNSNCHAAGSTNSGGPFTDYNKIFSRRSDIKIQVSTGQMPQSGSLTSDQKNKIICWVNSGAPNN